MIDKKLLERFWKDFYIITQEERQDFPYANPADAAKSLIKGRNWIGTWTELLIFKAEELNEFKKTLRNIEQLLKIEDRKILAKNIKAPGYVLKNAELLNNFVWSTLTELEKERYNMLYVDLKNCKDAIDNLESDKNNLELILKRLEKSTDWLIQYINWNKFELRGLQQ